MAMSSQVDSLYTLYHNEVGKHDLINAKQEAELFVKYHTCPKCSADLPQKRERYCCPACSALLPTLDHNTKSTLVRCGECASRFSRYVMPKTCSVCASPRDLTARNMLITSNLRFVVKKAKKLTADMSRRRMLISAGNLGLIHAVDRFEPARGHRFLTYADWWIRKEMYDAINESSLVKIPPQKRRAILRAISGDEHVCKHCGLVTSTPENAELPSCTKQMHEFEAREASDSTQLGNGIPLSALIPDGTDIESAVLSDDVKATFQTLLKTLRLTVRDHYILLSYYGLAQGERSTETKTLLQIATILQITPERVRQLKTKTLNELHRKARPLS